MRPDTGSDDNQVWLTVNGGGAQGFRLTGGYDDFQSEQSVYIADNFTWIKGRHTLQFGYEQRIHTQSKLQNWQSGGSVTYANNRQSQGGTRNGFADFLLGRGAGFAQDSSQDLQLTYPARELYFQDRMAVNRRLTAIVGLRWAPHFGVWDTRARFSTFRAGQQSTQFPTAPRGLVVPGDAGIPLNLYGTQWLNFGPGVGVAYDLLGNGRAALRLGYGINYDYQFLKGFNTYGAAPPYGLLMRPPTPGDLNNPYAGQDGSFPFQRPVPGAPENKNIKFAPYISQVYNERFRAITMNIADDNSLYSSLQTSLHKRYGPGFSVLGQYTLSSTRAQQGFRLNDNRRLDYFSPGADHNLSFTYAWDIPCPFQGSRVANYTLGGWQLGGTITARSGNWLSIAGNCQHNMSSAGCVGN